jgi:cobalt-zinc-cadmium efflux system protein
MHGGKGHSGENPVSGTAGAQYSKRLAIAFALTLGFMAAEVIGGLVTGSLALLADAAHMLTDAGGLALALLAIRFASKPATPERTYGYLRSEILAALLNAVVLLMLTVYILWEAYKRFQAPPEILSGPMLIVACIGLVVNFISMRLLAGGSSESLNVQGAYFEVLSDMLGSLGVILAALVVMTTGWTLADPLIGAGIGFFIVPRTVSLLRQAVHILMEGTPARVDVRLLEQALIGIPGVVAVHDLHVWTITSGLDAMSGHLVLSDLQASGAVLQAAQSLLKDRFKIDHTTIQLEDAAAQLREPRLHV